MPNLGEYSGDSAERARDILVGARCTYVDRRQLIIHAVAQPRCLPQRPLGFSRCPVQYSGHTGPAVGLLPDPFGQGSQVQRLAKGPAVGWAYHGNGRPSGGTARATRDCAAQRIWESTRGSEHNPLAVAENGQRYARDMPGCAGGVEMSRYLLDVPPRIRRRAMRRPRRCRRR